MYECAVLHTDKMLVLILAQPLHRLLPASGNVDRPYSYNGLRGTQVDMAILSSTSEQGLVRDTYRDPLKTSYNIQDTTPVGSLKVTLVEGYSAMLRFYRIRAMHGTTLIIDEIQWQLRHGFLPRNTLLKYIYIFTQE